MTRVDNSTVFSSDVNGSTFCGVYEEDGETYIHFDVGGIVLALRPVGTVEIIGEPREGTVQVFIGAGGAHGETRFDVPGGVVKVTGDTRFDQYEWIEE